MDKELADRDRRDADRDRREADLNARILDLIQQLHQTQLPSLMSQAKVLGDRKSFSDRLNEVYGHRDEEVEAYTKLSQLRMNTGRQGYGVRRRIPQSGQSSSHRQSVPPYSPIQVRSYLHPRQDVPPFPTRQHLGLVS